MSDNLARWSAGDGEALDALHGHRRVTGTENLTNGQKASIEAAMPSDNEVSTDRWADQDNQANCPLQIVYMRRSIGRSDGR